MGQDEGANAPDRRLLVAALVMPTRANDHMQVPRVHAPLLYRGFSTSTSISGTILYCRRA